MSGGIIIAGDCVPTKSNYEYFINGDVDYLFGKGIKELFKKSDFCILNLEVPLCDYSSPISKCGPNLIAPTKTVNALKKLGINLVTLANNHIMDQGIQGLKSTVYTLNKFCIDTVGAGENVAKAAIPFFFEFAGKKIGVYACAEHEFSIADQDRPGANPFDPLWSLDHVIELKTKVDYVIVLYHGGKEHYRYPSPELQKRCRRLVDKGANLVICQHSHCIGCEERYNEGIIVYGQGNFIFDYSDNECWQSGLLVKIDDKFNISYVPIAKNNNLVRLADDNKIVDSFQERSIEIQKNGFIEEKYTQFAEDVLPFYLRVLHGSWSLPFRILNKMAKGIFSIKYFSFIYNSKHKIAITNYIDCEAHRELILKGLKKAWNTREGFL